MARLARQAACTVCAGLLLAASPLTRAGDYEDGLRCWREGKYSAAYEALTRFRETPFGRNAQVDYMLGTSGCSLPDLQAWGQDYLAWMLRRYALPEDCRDIVVDALRHCIPSGPVVPTTPALIDRFSDVIGATSRLSGKMYYFVGQDEAVNNFAAVRVRTIAPAELHSRILPLDQGAAAKAAAVKRLPPGWLGPTSIVAAKGRFLFVSKVGKNDGDLGRTAEFLDRYVAFLEREYRLELPKAFITVYFVPTPEDIAALAKLLHGLKLGRATMGYSFRDDLSVLAVVPGGFTVGTVQHELFHLSVRSTFGDIPQWLDEGIASLYEVSRLDPDPSASKVAAGAPSPYRCTGLPNWRWKVLHEFWTMRPTIRQVITSDWYAFEQPDRAKTSEFARDHEEGPPSARAMATALATARYFALYLQEQQKLLPLYMKLQAQRPGCTRDAAAAAVKAVEEVMSAPLGTVDRNFAAWFEKLPPPTP